MQDSLSSNWVNIGRRCVPKSAELSISLNVCNLLDISVDYCLPCSPSVSMCNGSSATNSSSLCSTCANIDLKEYFRREIHVRWINNDSVRPSHDALRLGYLEDIRKRSESCSFCQLIMNAHCRRTWAPSRRIGRLTFRDTIESECYIFSYLYADNGGLNVAPVDSQLEEGDSQRAYRIGISVEAPTDGRTVEYLDHAGDIQLSATSAAQYGMPRLFHGRVFDSERVNISMARNWLSECETHHRQKCTLPDVATGGSASPAGPQDLLVVDVLRMNLCRMPHESRYITLSYCWPKVNNFVTTKSIVTELYIPGALRNNKERIIQVIQDAIQCVSELGERYLWVDALCIIQDDEQHKSSQIQQMDRVFGSSLLTLIHAPPAKKPQVEAHDGFVGYRRGSRLKEQHFYRVQGMELLIPFPDIKFAISKSRWTTRAWTYQEERLSRRKLYFTETQMYFQCSCAVFCEDSVGEGVDPSAFIHPRTNLSNPSGLYFSSSGLQKYLATCLTRTTIDDPKEAIAAYSRSLAQFSGRQMSNPRDILASFEGILAVFRECLKTEFLFGLPEKYLNETLLWVEAGPSLRRNVSINPSSSMTFPSWSWAGWNTAIEIERVCSGYIYPEVEWFVISQSGEAIQLVIPGSYNPSVHSKITSSNRNVRPPVELPDDFLETVQHQAGISESKKWELPRFLACWTCIASFGISDEESDVDEKMWTIWEVIDWLPVLDNVGHWAGSVFLRQSLKDNTKRNSRTFEFMLLSRSVAFDEDLDYYDEAVFTSREWCILNVMLIQRDEDRAQRLGIGVIHEDAWIEANPVPMLIKLE